MLSCGGGEESLSGLYAVVCELMKSITETFVWHATSKSRSLEYSSGLVRFTCSVFLLLLVCTSLIRFVRGGGEKTNKCTRLRSA